MIWAQNERTEIVAQIPRVQKILIYDVKSLEAADFMCMNFLLTLDILMMTIMRWHLRIY